MNKAAIFFLAMFLMHNMRYTIEYIHWTYCVRPYFFSIFTIESPMCGGLRSLSRSFGDTMSKALALIASTSIGI